MTNPIIIAFLGYAVLALVAIFDKSILSKLLKHPAVYAFYSTIFSVVAFVFLPFVGLPNGWDFLWSALSGITFGLGVWAMFVAFRHGEASHLSPFLGAVIAVVSFILSYIIFGSTLGFAQIIGVALLIIASFLLSFERSRANKGFHIGFVWAILSAVLFSASHVLAKYIYTIYPFIEGLVWTRGSVSFVGIFLFLTPVFHKQIFAKRKEEPKKEVGKYHTAKIVFFNKVMGIVSVLLIQYAISLGDVVVINAMAGVQYVLMFIFIFALTKLRPKLFSEYFTKNEVMVQSIAIILISVGLIFL